MDTAVSVKRLFLCFSHIARILWNGGSTNLGLNENNSSYKNYTKYIRVAIIKLQQLLSQTCKNVWRNNSTKLLSDFIIMQFIVAWKKKKFLEIEGDTCPVPHSWRRHCSLININAVQCSQHMFHPFCPRADRLVWMIMANKRYRYKHNRYIYPVSLHSSNCYWRTEVWSVLQ